MWRSRLGPPPVFYQLKRFREGKPNRTHSRSSFFPVPAALVYGCACAHEYSIQLYTIAYRPDCITVVCTTDKMAEPPKPDSIPEGAKYEAPKPPPKQNPVFRMMGELQ